MTRGRKLLVGCLGILGILFLAVIAAVFMINSWLRTPGETLKAHRLLDEQTGFLLEVTLPKENQAARDLVRLALEAQQSPNIRIEGETPEVLKWVLPHLPQKKVRDQDIDKALPLTLLVTAQNVPSPGGDPLFVINLPPAGRFPRLVDWMIGFAARRNDDTEVVEYGDEEYYHFRGQQRQLWACIFGTDFLLAAGEPQLRLGIDRLARSGAPTGAGLTPSPLDEQLAAAPGDTVLRFAAAPGRALVLATLLEPLSPQLAEALRLLLQDAAGASAWGRLEGADLLLGEIHTTAAGDGAWLQPGTRQSLVLAETGLVVVLEALADGPERTVSFRISGLQEALHRLPEIIKDLDRD